MRSTSVSIPCALSSRSFVNGAGLLGRLVPLVRRLLDLGAQHEDVLVHQGAPEAAAVDRSSHRVDLGHRLPSLLPAARARAIVAAAR